MKPGVSVLRFSAADGPPRVCADADEARGLGLDPALGEVVPLGMAVALSVREHHAWEARARALARLFVAEETGRTRVRFVVDPPDTQVTKLPRGVMLPDAWGGGEARVLCAHEGPCMCASHHPTRWLDVAGGRMVTVCCEERQVYWVERVDPLAEG